MGKAPLVGQGNFASDILWLGGEFPVAVSGLGVNSLFDPFGDISIVLSWSLLGCGGSFFLFLACSVMIEGTEEWRGR